MSISSISPTAPISSQSLRPVTPLSIPTPAQSNTPASISGTASNLIDQQKLQAANLSKSTDAAKNNLDTSKSDIANTVNQILGIQSNQIQTEADAGLPQKQTAVSNATNALEASQRSQTNELRALDGQGLTDVQKQAASKEINHKYAFEQADLALIQSAANRDYATAQSIVQRKTELALAPLQTKLDFQKTFYQDNKDTFNKADDRQYQNLIAQTQRDYDTQKTLQTSLSNVQLELLKNGTNISPNVMSQLNNAKSLSDVPQILAQNGVSLRDPNSTLQGEELKANIQKIKNDIANNKPINTANLTPESAAYVNGFQQAFIGLPAAQASTAKQVFTAALNSGNTEQIKQTILGTALSNIPAPEQAAAYGRNTAINALTNIQNLLDQAKEKGVNTGIVDGNLQTAAQKFGQSGNTDLAYIGTQMNLALNAYRKAVTGVAFSPQELAQYKTIFPDITNSATLNGANIQSLTDAFNQNNRAVIGTKIGMTNYDRIFGTEKANLPSGTVAPSGTTAAIGPDGATYFVPNAQLDGFIKDGGKLAK